MRILVVEDQTDVANSLVRGLREAGFNAEAVNSGEEALAAVHESRAPYDVAILDVMLGRGMDGIEVCRQFRNRGLPTAILMLTARAEVADRLVGFDAGADDYLAKPYQFEEVLARVRSLGRRWSNQGATSLVGDLELDSAKRVASIRGNPLSLTRKEFDILELFLRHPEQVLSKDQIHDYAWSDDLTPESNLVDTYVGRIRRKLADSGSTCALETVRGIGFKLLAAGPVV